MKAMKISVIGAGSTYSPELIDGFLKRQDKLRVKEFALMDISQERLSIVGGLIERMCSKFDEPPKVTMTESLKEAVENADYVVTQFRVGLLKARAKDEAIPLKYDYIGQETTGPGGFAKALRTIPEILKITDCMEKYAPQAKLINFTNPSGIITEAASKYSKIKVIGLCNGPITTFKRICEVMGWNDNEVFFDYFGLNHLGFIKGIYLKGKDVTRNSFAEILNHSKCDYMLGYAFNVKHSLAMQVLPVGYLQYYNHQNEIYQKLSSQETTRAEKLIDVDKELLKDYSNPDLKTKPAGLDQRGGAWYSEAAVALIDSMENADGAIHVINIQNNGIINELKKDAVIEVPAIVYGDSIKPLHLGNIPDGIAGLVHHVKEYESLTVKAGAEKSKDLALIALASHPFIRSINDAEKMLEEIISAHPDYIKLN